LCHSFFIVFAIWIHYHKLGGQMSIPSISRFLLPFTFISLTNRLTWRISCLLPGSRSKR